MEHLRTIIAGARSVFSSLSPREYPSYAGFAADKRNLTSDWKRVGDGLRHNLKQDKARRAHGKQADAR